MVKSVKISPDYKLVPWKYQALLEILWWCWKVKKVVPRHYKMGRREHCSRYMFLKLPGTITLVRKRWFLSKVLRLQAGKEYMSIKLFVIPISSYIWHHTLQPCDHNIPLSADYNSKMTLWVIHDQRFIINIVICHEDPHKRYKLFVVAFFNNAICFMMVDHSTV